MLYWESGREGGRVSCFPSRCVSVDVAAVWKPIQKTLLLPYLQRASKKKYLTCKVPPLHRSFSVRRVYLFFHLICIMYFLCIVHSDNSSFLYSCVHIYVYFIYIYVYVPVRFEFRQAGG